MQAGDNGGWLGNLTEGNGGGSLDIPIGVLGFVKESFSLGGGTMKNVLTLF